MTQVLTATQKHANRHSFTLSGEMEACHALILMDVISSSHLDESEEREVKHSCAKHLEECRKWAEKRLLQTGSHQRLTPSQTTSNLCVKMINISSGTVECVQTDGGSSSHSWREFQRAQSHAHKMKTWPPNLNGLSLSSRLCALL